METKTEFREGQRVMANGYEGTILGRYSKGMYKVRLPGGGACIPAEDIKPIKETYTEIKQRHRDELNAFPMAFAFSEDQLREALKKLDATKEECFSIGAGSIMRKSDRPAFDAMYKRHSAEMDEFFLNDESLIEAIIYELGNHEYCITCDPTDTVEALGLDMKQERIQDCFEVARVEYWKDIEDTD